MVRLLEAVFVAISGISAAVAVLQVRATRREERVEAWRREQEHYLNLLSDALLAVGEEAIKGQAVGRESSPEFEVAQLRLRRYLTDALSPLIEIDAIADVCGEPLTKITTELIEEAIEEVARTVNCIRDEAMFSASRRGRRLREALRA